MRGVSFWKNLNILKLAIEALDLMLFDRGLENCNRSGFVLSTDNLKLGMDLNGFLALYHNNKSKFSKL